jgi:NTP pyrophosphatase (non-canonical NTP hydrolase)
MDFTRDRWTLDDPDRSFMIEALGLAGEAGEVVDRLKKMVRNGSRDRDITEQRMQLLLEMGDLMFYYFRLMDRYDFTLEQIMEANVLKLKERYGE